MMTRVIFPARTLIEYVKVSGTDGTEIMTEEYAPLVKQLSDSLYCLSYVERRNSRVVDHRLVGLLNTFITIFTNIPALAAVVVSLKVLSSWILAFLCQ